MPPVISLNEECCSQQARSHCSCPQLRTLRGLRMEKSRILAPDSWGADQRNDSNEPRLLPLPIHRKALNSWTWDVWFSLMNSNLLKIWIPGFCCKDPYRSWLPPTSSQQSLTALWEAASWAWVLSFVRRIKQNSQLLGCAFLFQLTVLKWAVRKLKE